MTKIEAERLRMDRKGRGGAGRDEIGTRHEINLNMAVYQHAVLWMYRSLIRCKQLIY